LLHFELSVDGALTFLHLDDEGRNTFSTTCRSDFHGSHSSFFSNLLHALSAEERCPKFAKLESSAYFCLPNGAFCSFDYHRDRGMLVFFSLRTKPIGSWKRGVVLAKGKGVSRATSQDILEKNKGVRKEQGCQESLFWFSPAKSEVHLRPARVVILKSPVSHNDRRRMVASGDMSTCLVM